MSIVGTVALVAIGAYFVGGRWRRTNERSRSASRPYFQARSATSQPLSTHPTPPIRPAPSHPVPPWEAERSSKAKEAGRRGEEKVRSELLRLQLDALHDIILVDDKGPTQIDHVVKTPSGFVVLETKNYTGFVFGRWKASTWTQRVEHDGEKRDIPFQNPVHQNFRHRKAVEHALGGSSIAVVSHVVFVGDAKIGDSVARCILSFDKLGHALWFSGKPRADSGNLEAAWERLRLAAQRGELRRDEHLAALRSRPEWFDEHAPF